LCQPLPAFPPDFFLLTLFVRGAAASCGSITVTVQGWPWTGQQAASSVHDQKAPGCPQQLRPQGRARLSQHGWMPGCLLQVVHSSARNHKPSCSLTLSGNAPSSRCQNIIQVLLLLIFILTVILTILHKTAHKRLHAAVRQLNANFASNHVHQIRIDVNW